MAVPLRSSSSRRGDPDLRQRLGLLLLVFLLLVVTMTAATRATLADRDAAAADLERRLEPAYDGLYDLTAAMVDQGVDLGRRSQAAAKVSRALEGDPAFAASVATMQRLVAQWTRTDEANDELLAHLGEMRARLTAADRQAHAEMEEAQQRLYWLLWTILVLAIGWVAASMWCIRRWVMAPLRLISQAANDVSDGDFHRPIPAVGSSELAGLARDVERMRARTVGLYEASERAAEALEQQGAVVSSVRAELAPTHCELPDGAVFAAAFEPAEGVLAGDWYECMNLVDGRLGLAVVDVSGHGPEAGIFALRAKHLLRAALKDGKDPGAALNWLASHIGETGERFLTALVVEVDTVAGRCRWANAGHPPGVVIGPDDVRRLEPTGPILGPLPGEWQTQAVDMRPGATLIAYTDGIVEARAGDRQFGYERLFRLFESLYGENPASLVADSVREVRRFAGGRTSDDMTLVALSMQTVGAIRSADVAVM